MNALTKALNSSRAFANSATKMPAGSLGEMMSPGPAMGSMGGSQNAARYRQRYSLFRGWLYSAINAIAEQAAGQAVNLGRLKKPPQEQKSPSRTKNFHMQRMTKSVHRMASQQDMDIVEDDPLLLTLNNPNPLQPNTWEFVYSFVANLCLTGWSYVVAGESREQGQKKGEGRLELYSLPTTWIHPIRSKDGWFGRFKVLNPNKPAEEAVILDRSQVAFAHLPNPADPLTALAPTGTQIQSVRIDDHIQASQEAFFENGIFPSVMIKIGKIPFMDSEKRPMLTGAQRRQINSAINKGWRGVRNSGNPVILDGLIESVERFSSTAFEMGWDKSEDKNRTRLLSAFGVHPYILGEAVGVGGYAQVANIEKRFCQRTNTYLDMLSNCLTNFVGVIRPDEGLVVWWDKCEPRDDSLYWTNINKARDRGDISQDENRALLGFSPDEDGNQSYYKPQALTGLSTLLDKIGQSITNEQAQAALEGMGIPEELARRIAGEPTDKQAVQEATEAIEAAVQALRVPSSVLATKVLEDMR